MLADRGDDLQIERIDLAGEERDLLPRDAGLVQGSLPLFTAQHVGMIAAHVGQQRGDHIQRPRLVIAPAHAGLDRCPLDIIFFEKSQSDEDRRLKKRVGMVRILQGKANAVRLDHRLPKLGDIFAGGKLTVDAEALTIVEQVRAHESAGLADGGQAGLQKSTGRPFAAGAGHMDQLGRMAVGPERPDRLAHQFQPRQLGRRPLGMVDLVDGVVVRKVRLCHGVCSSFATDKHRYAQMRHRWFISRIICALSVQICVYLWHNSLI